MNVTNRLLASTRAGVARIDVQQRIPALSGVFNACSIRSHSTDGNKKATSSVGKEWRKTQLENLEKKFLEPLEIESEEELQPMWQSMESRVKHRKPRTLQETGGKTGRVNIRKTDEEMWLKEGLYDEDSKA
jgi:hypothetical protein